MPEKRVERIAKYNLSGASEDTYASQTAQNPTTARRAKSLFPSPAGYLERENPNAKFSNTQLPSGVVWLFEFDQVNTGVVTRFYFAATTATLYMLTGGVPGVGVWTAVAAVGTLANTPQAVSINNLMHFSDGVTSWVFDGTNWVTDGLPIPLAAPVLTAQAPSGTTILTAVRANGVVTITTSGTHGLTVGVSAGVIIGGVTDTSFNGTVVANVPTSSTLTYNQLGQSDASSSGGTVNGSGVTIQSNRFYWFTYADVTNVVGGLSLSTHPHESTSSPRSLGTGAQTNKQITVSMLPGLAGWSTPLSIVGVGTAFSASDVGKFFYSGQLGVGIIVSVQDAQHLTVASNAVGPVQSSTTYTIAPTRATHWNLYCSETENSAVGFFLASISIVVASYVDVSPFLNDPASYINQTLQRPLRNDPTTATRVMTVHKRRIFRRNESLPNFFNYTSYEEVKAQGVGTAEECVPGHDPNTLSDVVDEQSYPDESRRIIGMVPHADALFIGTEKNVTPLFGESFDDFVLSQITSFSVGFGSPYMLLSTPHGLIFLSYDRKVYLWPQQWIPFYAPEETTALIELSRPKRLDFQNMNPAAMGAAWGAFFNYGKRNWLVTAFQDAALAWHTWVFDFETKGWFEMQRGVQSLAVFEVSPGVRVLVGGGTDGFVYILDDPSVFFPVSGSFPLGTFRPSLIDFGQPDSKHMLLYVEFETSSSDLANDITVNYYLDPLDADNPGTPIKVQMAKVRGANRYRGFFVGGSVCERVLMEFSVASSQNIGVVRSISLAAKPVSKLIL